MKELKEILNGFLGLIVGLMGIAGFCVFLPVLIIGIIKLVGFLIVAWYEAVCSICRLIF